MSWCNRVARISGIPAPPIMVCSGGDIVFDANDTQLGGLGIAGSEVGLVVFVSELTGRIRIEDHVPVCINGITRIEGKGDRIGMEKADRNESTGAFQGANHFQAGHRLAVVDDDISQGDRIADTSLLNEVNENLAGTRAAINGAEQGMAHVNDLIHEQCLRA